MNTIGKDCREMIESYIEGIRENNIKLVKRLIKESKKNKGKIFYSNTCELLPVGGGVIDYENKENLGISYMKNYGGCKDCHCGGKFDFIEVFYMNDCMRSYPVANCGCDGDSVDKEVVIESIINKVIDYFFSIELERDYINLGYEVINKPIENVLFYPNQEQIKRNFEIRDRNYKIRVRKGIYN